MFKFNFRSRCIPTAYEDKHRTEALDTQVVKV